MIAVYVNFIADKPFCSAPEKAIGLFYSLLFFSIRVTMSWNIGDNKNDFLKLESKMEFYHVVLVTPKTYPKKTYSKCSWNATSARHWENWFQRRNVLPIMDNKWR